MKKHIAIYLLFLCLIACSMSQQLHVGMSASNDLNPNQQGQSLPVMVRVVQLSSPDQFQQANYNQLWRQAKGTLSDSWVASRQLILSPGKSVDLHLPLSLKTQYLGVIALFREPGNHWRLLLPLQLHWFDVSHRVQLRLHHNRLWQVNT